jgi:carboxyl-terminal processing protease
MIQEPMRRYSLLSGNRKKIIVLIIMLAFFIITAAEIFASPDNRSAHAYTREDVREKLRKKHEFDYKPYLTGERKLNFNPDESLYRQVYYYVSLRYVEPVNDKVLVEGVFNQVAKLLKQANIDPSGLQAIPRTDNPMPLIVNAYGKQVNPSLLRLAAVQGLLDALNDPHSTLMLPDDYKKLRESMAGGNFSGIGVYIMSDPDNYNMLTVSEPIEGTPAQKAGLKAGDVILAINGESTKDEPIDVSVAKIRGPEGSPVSLRISRKGLDKPFDIQIRRAFIHVNSVVPKLIDKQIGYLKLNVYGSDTAKELEEAMTALEKRGAKAYILDLRNNAGGLIDSAEQVCSKFLPAGTPVVHVVDRSGGKRIYRAKGGEHPKFPMVVMINELSASASEITAGALRDNKRAILVGEKSFGKGSVQELMPIQGKSSDPAALKLTVALFYTPNGTKINKAGLEPDIKVPMELKNIGVDNYKEDIQLQRAVQHLQGQLK